MDNLLKKRISSLPDLAQGTKTSSADIAGIPNSTMQAIARGTQAPTSAILGRRENLEPSLQEKMQGSFGADFGNVEIYRSETAKAAGFNGITSGNKIALSPDVNLSSHTGQATLGHELSHVVAQAQGIGGGRGFLGNAGLERQADIQGERAASGMRAAAGSGLSMESSLDFSSQTITTCGMESGTLTPISATAGAFGMGAPMQGEKNKGDDENAAAGGQSINAPERHGPCGTVPDKLARLSKKEEQRLQMPIEDGELDERAVNQLRSAGSRSSGYNLERLIGNTMTEEQMKRFRPTMHGNLFRSMKANVSSDYGVAPEVRQNMFNRLNELQAQETQLRNSYAKYSYAKAVLLPRLDGDSAVGTQIADSLAQLEQKKVQLEGEANALITIYQREFRGTLAGKEARNRYDDRVSNYMSYSGKNEARAEQEIQRRAIVPETVHNLDKKIEDYKSGENPHYYEGTRARAEGYEDMYYEQMNRFGGGNVPQAEKEVAAYLKAMTKDYQYVFRTNPTAFGLMTGDKMKNQMEVNSSGGVMGTDIRKEFTRNQFDVSEGELAPSEHENYGYMGTPDLSRANESWAGQYGQVMVTLNKGRMKGRTTTTFGDSLYGAPTSHTVPADNPQLAAVERANKRTVIRKAHEYAQNPGKEKPDLQTFINEHDKGQYANEHKIKYMELQFHGDVTARDMEAVTLCIPVEDGHVMRQNNAGKADRVNAEFVANLKEQYQSMSAQVKEINAHPEQYGRIEMPPLKLRAVFGTKVVEGESNIRSRINKLHE